MTAKARRLAMLLCACSVACAESPPITNNQGSLTPNPVTAGKPPAALANDYELMKRIEQMQAEVQQLTGKVDEQAFQIEELKKQQKTMYTDFDDRIQNLENKSGTGQPVGEAPTSSTGSSSSDTGEVKLTPAAPSEQPADNNLAPTPALAPALTPEPDIASLPASEKEEYQFAYNNLRNGRTTQAIVQFKDYIAKHPNSSYASNAQYWLGEAHRVDMDNTSARQAFNAVIEKYPASSKVPDALLKLGYIEMEEKNTEKAREILTRVTTEFANSRAAVIAQKKLATLH